MNIALFGGTFDPIHRGHLAVARAAARRFRLDRVLFVPCDQPPLRPAKPLAGFPHRYAMVALATAGEPRFVPSLLEATGTAPGRAGPRYSLYTVRRVRKALQRGDRLYFLLGMDAFAGIAGWHRAETLLTECDFIVVSRPGYSLQDAAAALPRSVAPWGLERSPGGGRIVLPRSSVYLLGGVRQAVSATAARRAAAAGRPLAGLVGRAVAAYIAKMGLYRGSGSPAGR